MLELQPAADEARRFLDWLGGPGAVFHFQTFCDRGEDESLARTIVGTWEQCRGQLTKLSSQGAGVYVAVQEHGQRGPRKLENVTRIRAMVADLDGSPLAAATTLTLEPSIIVETSPQRFHCYWLARDLPLAWYRDAEEALCERVAGDPSACEPSRVLRIPGFPNQKRDSPHPVRAILASALPPSRYRARDLLAMLGLDADALAIRIEQRRVSAASHDEDAHPGKMTGRELARVLSRLDPRDFNSNESWLALLLASHHATSGAGREAFVSWSAGDPAYASRRRANAARWDGVRRSAGRIVTRRSLAAELRRIEAHDEADFVLFHDLKIPDSGPPPEWLEDKPLDDDRESDGVDLAEDRAPKRLGVRAENPFW